MQNMPFKLTKIKIIQPINNKTFKKAKIKSKNIFIICKKKSKRAYTSIFARVRSDVDIVGGRRWYDSVPKYSDRKQ